MSASHYFSFLSKRSGRRMPPEERSALYILGYDICTALLHRSNTRGERRRDVHCRAVGPAPDGPLEWLLEGLARHADAEPGVLEGHVQGSLERLVCFPVARHDNNQRTYVRRRETAALTQWWPKGDGGARETEKGDNLTSPGGCT